MKYTILLILLLIGSILNNVYSQTRTEKVVLFFEALKTKNTETILLYSEDVLKKWKEDYGKDTTYASILFEISEVSLGIGDVKKAIERNYELIEVNKKIYGEKSEYYIYSKARQADLYYQVQDYQNALLYYRECDSYFQKDY